MSLLRSMERFVRRAFPGFPEHHVSRLGSVVAIPDAPAGEKGTDRFRPRYAVDVQLITPGGKPDTGRPVLRGLALPSFCGLYGFPEIGTHVRIGYDYGLPSHPYIADVLSEGQPAPAILPGERLWRHSPEAFQRFDAKGNLTIQTNGELREDSGTRTIEADATTETHGEITTNVEGDWNQKVGGSLEQEILGALARSVAGDARLVTLGGEDRTVAGDKSELVGGNAELVAQLDLTLKANLGDVLIEAIVGSATLQGAVKSSMMGALIDLGLTAGEALVLGNAFLTLFNAHVHPDPLSGSTGVPTVPMIAGVETSATVKTK